MQYIVIDLEWNQPISYQNRAYREFGDRLIFEMIQIGAAKLNEQMQVTDTISVPIRPTCYKQVHPRIRRMTGLGPEILDDAPEFREALDTFLAWCGEDYVLLTWGCDDISVLQQNLDFFDCHPQLPPVCDIQRLFSDVHKRKDRMGLKAAMEMLELQPEEDKAFHNAENDAYYTGLVFATLPDPKAVLTYTQQPKKLIHEHRSSRRGMAEQFDSLADALASEAARTPGCPACDKVLALEGEYVPQSPDKYVSLARCKTHGRFLVRLSLRMEHGHTVTMRTSVLKATAASVAYVHTKQLQVANKRSQGRMPEPEAALRDADRSSVPFDE